MESSPVRYLSKDDILSHRPVHAVWEITLACDLRCRHCGSRAGRRRPEELTTEECLDVVRQLEDLGTREVTLIGGEAYLRKDWVSIIRAVADAGMLCTLQTGARSLTDQRIEEAADAGLGAVGISIDGLRDLHDGLRGVSGSFDLAVDALKRLRAHDITSSVNTQISAETLPQLRALMETFIALGVKNWQVQLTVAMGRATDNPELLMQPYQILELMPLLAEIYQEAAPRGLLLQIGNNVGYFGPYEGMLRGSGSEFVHWNSCPAGRVGLGIEADGTIKGCPSLPTSTYAGGNIRDLTLKEIWNYADELSFSRIKNRDELWGFCHTCYYAEVCIGGCSWTAHSLLGKRGNNPYCYHRALELAKLGQRERIVRQVKLAPGRSFDYGRFEIVRETLSAEIISSTEIERTEKIRVSASSDTIDGSTSNKLAKQRLPFMELCRGCQRHILPETEECPHCGGNVRALADEYEEYLASARQARERLVSLLNV